jgi:hypothetical protein
VPLFALNRHSQEIVRGHDQRQAWKQFAYQAAMQFLIAVCAAVLKGHNLVTSVCRHSSAALRAGPRGGTLPVGRELDWSFSCIFQENPACLRWQIYCDAITLSKELCSPAHSSQA